MRALTDSLLTAQQAGFVNALYKVVLTKGASSYTYDKTRILPSKHDEEMYSQVATIVLHNRDHELDDINLKGYDAVISYGVISSAGEEYSATATLSVIDQQFDSDPNNLICTLFLEGTPNLMAEDEASESYIPDADNENTAKTLLIAIAGATLAPYTHCKAWAITFDEGYDTLLDTYKPKDGFRIYERSKRLAAFRRVLDYSANVARFRADGIHILKPVISGVIYNSEYSLARGSHTFFKKAYRETLVIPNRFVVKSLPDDEPAYEGSAQVSDYASLPDSVKKTRFVRVKLESDDQADDIAEALLSKAETGCARGSAEVPLNCGSEVFDYVKITDSRQGDSRTGNLGYVHRRFGGDNWTMTFGFGNWLESLRYQAVLKGLENYTDAGQYFSRLSVGDLYAENLTMYMDEITDGPDVYVRQKSLQLNATGLYLAEDTLYTIRVPGEAQHALHKSDTAPTSPETGDFWIDTNFIPNVVKMWDGDSWDELTAAEVAEFNRGTIYRELKNVALTPDGLVILDQVQEGTYGKVQKAALSASGLILIDQTVDGTYGKILFSNIEAGGVKGGAIVQSADYRLASDTEKATWNSKVKTFYQTSPPTSGMSSGDLWFDTNDKNKIYRYSGTSWVAVRDTDIAQALADAAAAYDTAVEAYDLGTEVQGDIVAGYLTLSQYTEISGEWYLTGGVMMHASKGIRIYGTSKAFSTYANYADASAGTNAQCYMGTDGKIWAGAGAVSLGSDGLIIVGQYLTFKYGTTTVGNIYGYNTNVLNITVPTGKSISLGAGATMTTVGWLGIVGFTGVDMSGEQILLLPRKTSAPSSPSEGMAVYNSSTGYTNIYHSGAWHHLNRDAGWA